ncbi:DUF3093 domain-containing protein [Mycobacterium conspicuum]|jgi:hypothetical protein|uniref:Uncharacterized protein n=1 Tax=Mycobacterium conspicuum TaxID=44010 RepID=A0A1X1SWP9_9MYCO|nr:DUF3093 domain-containing protein [Mycobacterium conspicuum]ORV35351.1 hypothetical protein AWC00_25320 [Mycobacterium conspicuum]BBZ37337.1 hypothetical protein MCNS_04000 [Mycobacterium conspicuum]
MTDKPLFHEPGASWYWLLAGPAAAVSMILIEMSSHAGVGLTIPVIFLVMVTLFLGIQIKAARIHTSVELTEDALRQGTETILVREIVKVYPEAENSVDSGLPLARWQTARTLGELNGIPRGRVGIGLRLTGGRTAQAWARRHRHLRDALTPLVQERVGPTPELAEDDEYDDYDSPYGEDGLSR